MLRYLKFIIFPLVLFFSYSCNQDDIIEENVSTSEVSTPDWTEQTHGIYYPDYQTVFPSDNVNRIDLVVENTFWNEMNTDLQNNLRASNTGPMAGPAGETDFDPVWVPAEFYFHGKQWYKVGIRFKGNSSLRSTYQKGLKKFSFKLDFDQFEDEYPAIQNQRFYGFKQLNLKNNFEDQSFLREKVASDLFYEFGLASPKTAFYQLFVDYGDGPQYFGLYTLVEEVDDTLIKTQFDQQDGNLYKPEGNGATFAEGSFNNSDMDKQTNAELNDYSDVEKLYTIVNSSARNTDYDTWKTELSAVFNIPVFLKWLAANTVIQNWDTYGKMSHNYFLYNNPENNLLTWIPWDNNEALQNGKMGGAHSFSMNEIGNNWPLIRYILDDQEWMEEYKLNISGFIADVFYAEKMTPVYEKYQSLISEFVIGESGELSGYSFLNNDNDFNSAIEYLKQHVSERKTLAQQFLSENQ